MTELKNNGILVLSDTHFDFMFRADKAITESRVKFHLKDWMDTNGAATAMLIAGDIGHYVTQNVEVLKIVKDLYGLEPYIVLGNHSFYNVSKSKRYKSFADLEKYTIDTYRENGITVLDGDIAEVNGLKVLGYAGWYDGLATYNIYNSKIDADMLWKDMMNDYKYIPGAGSIKNLVDYQREKVQKYIDNPQKVDLLLTHVQPFLGNAHMVPEYKNDITSSFYMQNTDDLLDAVKPDLCVYGHTHNRYNYTRNGVEYIVNPIGYPGEHNNPMQIII